MVAKRVRIRSRCGDVDSGRCTTLRCNRADRRGQKLVSKLCQQCGDTYLSACPYKFCKAISAAVCSDTGGSIFLETFERLAFGAGRDTLPNKVGAAALTDEWAGGANFSFVCATAQTATRFLGMIHNRARTIPELKPRTQIHRLKSIH